MRLATPEEYRSRSSLPVGKILVPRQGAEDCHPIDTAVFLGDLLEVVKLVTFTTRGSRDKFAGLLNRMKTNTYWHPSKESARVDDMQWLIDEINKACPPGIYFGTLHDGSVDQCSWGFWSENR